LEQVNSVVRSLIYLDDKNESSDKHIEYEIKKHSEYSLTDSGKLIVENGDPAFELYSQLPTEPVLKSEFVKTHPKFAEKDFGQAVRRKIITVTKLPDKSLLVSKNTALEKTPTDEIKELLEKISKNDLQSIPKQKIDEFSKAKFIAEIKKSEYLIKPGKLFTGELKKESFALSADDLVNDNWKNLSFTKYKLNAKGIPIQAGAFHPLLKMREEMSSVLVQMGFKEMKTDQYIENSFWNFDALFTQQNHPARDDHDTFFIKDSAPTNIIPGEVCEAIKSMHENIYKTPWSYQESEKKVLRTHTTAVSAKLIHDCCQEVKKGDQSSVWPLRYFSIDKVFRNETLDSTHLAEFHQIEGWVAGENLSLSHLMGQLREFYKNLGIEKIKFKSTFNPYTEPSMEVHGYHPQLNEWIELANSGIFRPEMTAAWGVDPNIRIIAWGLSLERPTMIKYGIKNIRELYGHKVDLAMVQKSGLCLFK